jgi:hypothetical protein
MRARLRSLAILVLLGPAACARVAPRAEPAGAGELDHLRALGYVDYSPRAEPRERAGVVLRDAARSQPGYNLFASRALARAELMDANGNVVRVWQADDGGQWSHVRLLPDGDLLVVGSCEGNRRGGRIEDANRYLERRRFDGPSRWRREVPVHHDVNVAPDGRLMALISEDRVVPELDPEAEVRDEGIEFLTPDGEALERRLFVPMLLARPDVFRFQPVARRQLDGRVLSDLLHANSIEWLDRPALAARHPIYARGNVLVSMRHQDTIAIFDWDAGEVVWAWGQGLVRGPHDASLLENGNILLFDNRLGEGWSRVVELDPIARREVWEWRAPVPTDFYTRSRGSAQRLPDGNTLIAESDRGHAFEVTPEGDVVWDFWNPNRDADGRPATIIRMDRYPAGWVEPLLAAPGG